MIRPCTSAIAGPSVTRDSTIILWKNRDTGVLDNFVERVPARNGRIGYVALFNAGDSTLSQAWIGVNEVGFGILNTASYNLVPDTAAYRDREGYIMADALGKCRQVNDFETMLDTMARPMGVQTNFGVADRDGNMAYYEVWDAGYTKYVMTDEDKGLMIRTNYSYSGDTVTQGFGYIRHSNAEHLLRGSADIRSITPSLLVDTVSCSFYHALYGKDLIDTTTADWLMDQDFIPRHSTSASAAVVIDLRGGEPTMYVALGYPPTARGYEASPSYVPETMRPHCDGYRSEACNAAMERKKKIFSIVRGSGPRYINTSALRKALKERHDGK